MGFRKLAAMFSVVAVASAIVGCSSDTASTPSGSSGTTGALYERLGKAPGIAKAITAIVDAELKDPEIASFFFNQVKTTIPAGHPSRAQIEECLVAQLGNAAGGPEKFPTMVSGGFTCRDMRAAHVGLGIPNGTFSKFITIAAGVLKGAGVADADITTIGKVLDSARPDTVQDTTRDGGGFQAPDGG